MYKIGIIGVGNMGEAILRAIIDKTSIKKSQIVAFDIDKQKLKTIEKNYQIKTTNTPKTVTKAKYIFVVVKPKDYKTTLDTLKKYLSKENVLISVIAGIKIENIKKIIKKEIPIVRIMPNTPMLIGEGTIGVTFDKNVKSQQRKYLSELFSKLGETIFVDEEIIDTVTGLSGSGPAYVFTFIDAMAQGGVKMGLSYEDALKLAVQTVIGSAKMIKELNQHPSVLRDKVTSPAGTTIYGLHELEKKGLKDAVISAIETATLRSKNLS
ncbi:MAG: pyrroline-5-carboxylate reductase [Aquificae bacterium]|nr:pyrroline-5-carboxylate reductase [Aquificota bacterium]